MDRQTSPKALERMIPEGQNDIDLDRIKEHVTQLAEHFDTVHIFVTRHEEGDIGTTNASWCHGSYFTRRGQIEDWVIKQDERTRLEAKRDWQADRT